MVVLYKSTFSRISLLILLVFSTPICAAYQQYCKCECSDPAIDNRVLKVDNCVECTKDLFYATGYLCKEELMKLNCFHLQSSKDAVIIYSFLTLVAGLLAYRLYRRHYDV